MGEKRRTGGGEEDRRRRGEKPEDCAAVTQTFDKLDVDAHLISRRRLCVPLDSFGVSVKSGKNYDANKKLKLHWTVGGILKIKENFVITKTGNNNRILHLRAGYKNTSGIKQERPVVSQSLTPWRQSACVIDSVTV